MWFQCKHDIQYALRNLATLLKTLLVSCMMTFTTRGFLLMNICVSSFLHIFILVCILFPFCVHLGRCGCLPYLDLKMELHNGLGCNMDEERNVQMAWDSKWSCTTVWDSTWSSTTDHNSMQQVPNLKQVALFLEEAERGRAEATSAVPEMHARVCFDVRAFEYLHSW